MISVVQNERESSGQIANSQLSTDDSRFVVWQGLEFKIHYVFVSRLQITVVRGLLTVNNDPRLPILSNKNLTADYYI